VGIAPSGHPVEIGQLIDRAIAESEAQLRSGGALAVATLVGVLVALGPSLPFGHWLVGQVTSAQAAIIASSSWALFAAATAVLHATKSPHHPAYRALAALDELGRHGVILSLIYFSGSALSPLWVIGLARAFSWTALAQTHLRLTVTLLVVSHGALVAAFLSTGRLADAALTVLVVLASFVVCMMTARSSAQGFQARAERDLLEREVQAALLLRDRDRIARELHDGVGSDVMTLVLRLRRAADEGTTPDAAALMESAERILDDLRRVVWSLRNEQGTLAELGKMIDLTCRGRGGGRRGPAILFQRTTPPEFQRTRIGPLAALEALDVIREQVRDAELHEGVTKMSVVLTLRDASTLEITIDRDGAAPGRASTFIPLDEIRT
jgi:hypothetical protein